MKIPKFKKYFATTSDMNPKQKEFYDYWSFFWKKGKKVPVKGNISYIFCYIYDILRLPFETETPESKVGSGLAIIITVMYDGKPAPKGLKKNYEMEVKIVINELKKIIKKYPEEEKLLSYCKLWLSDCYILLRDYKKAMSSAPELKVESQSEMFTDRLLSLKLKLGKRLSGKDILTLNGPKVTHFGKRNLNRIIEYLDAQINSEEKREKISLLKQWKKGTPQSDYSIFLGTSSSFQIDESYYQFSKNQQITTRTLKMIQEAENTCREEMGIPKIGEGWISETELYYKIKEYLKNLDVIHHARPKWLGHQHLDIYIPKLKVAIEYQGSQHYKPIDYFGGIKAYKAVKKRDSTKKRKCTLTGIRLIYVKEGYDFDKLMKEINNREMGGKNENKPNKNT